MKNIQSVTKYKGNLSTCFTGIVVNIELIGVLSFFKSVLVIDYHKYFCHDNKKCAKSSTWSWRVSPFKIQINSSMYEKYERKYFVS